MTDETAAPEGTPAKPTETPTETPSEVIAQPDDWRSSLPPELRDNPTLQDTKSVEALAKRFLDTKSALGNSIRIPGPDAPDEDKQAFKQSLMEKNLGLMETPDFTDESSVEAAMKVMGLPDTPDDYQRPENWAGVDDDRYSNLAQIAHDAKLTKTQFEKMASQVAALDNQYMEAREADRAAGIGELKTEWGRAYDQKVQRAGHIAKQLDAPPNLQAALEKGDVDAETYRWLDKMATRFSKEGNNLVNTEGMVSEQTPTELNDRIQEITKKMLGMNPTDPQYQGLLQKRIKYAEMLTEQNSMQ